MLPLDRALPDDLFRVVCQFLEWDELLLEVRRVSRFFLRQVSNPLCWPWLRLRLQGKMCAALPRLISLYCCCQHGGMWSRLVGFGTDILGMIEFMPPLLAHASHLTFLDASCFGGDTRFATLESFLSSDGGRCGAQLRHLDLPTVNNPSQLPSAARCLAMCRNLESLALNGDLDALLADLPRSLPCLRLLCLQSATFSSSVFAEHVGRCTQLQSLQVSGDCEQVDDACVLAVVRGCPGLLQLGLPGILTVLTSASLQHIGAHAHNLRMLVLGDALHISADDRHDMSLADWACFCAGVPQLRFFSYPAFTDSMVEALCLRCPRLQFLQLGIHDVTHAGLRCVARLAELRGLRVVCDEVTDGGIAELLACCPRLADVPGCAIVCQADQGHGEAARCPWRAASHVLLPAACQAA